MARKPVFKTTPTDEVQPLVETSPFQASKPSKKRINEASLVRQRNETNGLKLIFFIHPRHAAMRKIIVPTNVRNLHP